MHSLRSIKKINDIAVQNNPKVLAAELAAAEKSREGKQTFADVAKEAIERKLQSLNLDDQLKTK